MKKLSFYACLCLCMICMVWGCSSEDISDYPPSNMRSIVRFTLNPAQNGGNVQVQHVATIDQSVKTIMLKLPPHLDLTSVRPEITLSPWTTVSPANLEAVDFTQNVVEYTVTAESGKQAVYEVILDMTYQYQSCVLYAVYFPGIIDPETGEALRAVCNENYKTATIRVPASADVTKMTPYYELSMESYNATFDKAPGMAYDFTEPLEVTVTAEDGKSSATYTLTVIKEED